MSLREALALKVEDDLLDIEMDDVYPDRIYVNDDAYLEGVYERAIRRDEEDDVYILLSDAHRLAPNIPDDTEFKERYPWLEQAIEDSKWAYSSIYGSDTRAVAWTIGDRLVIQAPFTLTLSENVNKIPASMCSYSMGMAGWVLVDPGKNSDQMTFVLSEYGIATSHELKGYVEGRGDWRLYLAEHVNKAIDLGYRVPDIFPTDRTLKDHQKEAVLALAGNRTSLLADQVGLGKGGEFTSGFLSIAQKFTEDTGKDISEAFPVVVVTTNSMKEEIAEEVIRWKQDAKVEVLYGHKLTGIDEDTEFIVMNVDLLSKRLDDVLSVSPRGMIVDECHTLKNPAALRTKAAQAIADNIRENYGEDAYITLASGTPFLNRPVELWSILCILGKDQEFGNYALSKIGKTHMKIRTRNGWRTKEITLDKAFEERWCDGHYDRYKDWINTGSSNRSELNMMLLKHGMIRRKKSDVMHPLPPLHEKILKVDLDPEYADEYQRIESEFREWMIEQAKERAERDDISISMAISIIKRSLSHSEAVMRMTALRQAVARAKIKGIKEWVHRFMAGDPDIIGDDPDRKKLIIFAYHREIQQLLMEDPELAAYGMVFIRAGEDPQDHKIAFQKDPDVRLMICYSGAREGHTLTAAKDILLAEIPFVPSWVVQMAGRCWARLSEDFEPHDATIHYAVTPETIDSLLMNKIRLKKETFTAIIDGEDYDEQDEDHDGGDDVDVMLELMSNGHKVINIAA